MASTSVDGLSVVWDLRQSRPIIRFSESAAIKYGDVHDWCLQGMGSVVSWRQVAMCCCGVEPRGGHAAGDSQRGGSHARDPGLGPPQRSLAPQDPGEAHPWRPGPCLVVCVCVSVGMYQCVSLSPAHMRSPKDADMLVTCGKDNRTLIWDPNSDAPGGEVVAELPPTMNWNFDVKWCARNPSLVATSSFAGTLTLFNVTEQGPAPAAADPFGNLHIQGGQQAPAMGMQKAPKWLKRPAGASFAFGGRIVRYSGAHGGVVKVETVVTEAEVVQRSVALQSSLAAQQAPAFCALKAAQAGDGVDSEVWQAMGALFVPERRAQLARIMGVCVCEL